MKKRGQIAMEYVIIFSLAMLISLPALFVFRNYVVSSSDKITEQRISSIATEILNTARKVYYYGAPSKEVFGFEMPEGIVQMGVITLNDEYVLAFKLETSDGTLVYHYESEVPIVACDGVGCSFVNCNSVGYSQLDEQCSGNCRCLPEADFNKGKKNFKIEASDDSTICPGVDLCVIIDEVTEELYS